MPTLDQLDALEGALDVNVPSTSTGSTYARRRVAVAHWLASQGAIPGAVPLHRLDLSGVTASGSGFTIPSGFLGQVRTAFPAAFGDTANGAAFDARTASAEALNQHLRDLATGRYRRRVDAATARTMADLERTYSAA